MERKRLELGVPTEPRNASLDKDALIQNAYVEKNPMGVFAIKRPGFVTGSEGVTTGINRGIFYHNGTVWYVTNDSGILGGWVPSGFLFGAQSVVVSNEDFV